jgi:BioD-like phosphotransacetylase family protein
LTIIYVTSNSAGAGKTLISAGLCQIWQKSEYKTAFLKLAAAEITGDLKPDSDVIFMGRLNGCVDDNECARNYVQSAALVQRCNELKQTSGYIICEGPLPAVFSAAKLYGGKILLVHDYDCELEKNLPEYLPIKENLIGIVVNKVPQRNLDRLYEKINTSIMKAGLNCLGVIPEDRRLMTISIKELAEAVQGKMLNSENMADELVENVMLGSSTFDRGAAYYDRKANKAVLLWGERPGFRKAVVSNYQLAALQTPTRCIVISHSGTVLPAVMEKATQLQVPLISAPGTLPEIIQRLEQTLIHSRFDQFKKLPLLVELLSSRLNVKLIE